MIPFLMLMSLSQLAHSEEHIQELSAPPNPVLSIQESGQIDSSVKGKNLSIVFFDGRERGIEANQKIKNNLSDKGIKSNGGWLPKSFKISAYTHTYSSDKTTFDSGAIMIKDIKPDALVMSSLHASESILIAHKNQDLAKLDAGVVHEGAKLSQAMGSTMGASGGVAINLVANLTRRIFSSTPSAAPLDGGHFQNGANLCADACHEIHHAVVFTVLYDAEPSHFYSISIDKLDNKVNDANLIEIANQGLQMVTEKIADAVVAN